MTARKYLTQKQKAELMLKQSGNCAACGKRLIPGLFQFDHIQALEHDGDNELDNWRALCTKPCHKTKTKADKQGAAKRDRIAVGGKQSKRPFQKPNPNWVRVSFGVYERKRTIP